MVYEMRRELFRTIYSHRIGQAIDLMYRDALIEADPMFNFLENLNKPDVFVNWTDSISKLIMKSTNPAVKKS